MGVAFFDDAKASLRRVIAASLLFFGFFIAPEHSVAQDAGQGIYEAIRQDAEIRARRGRDMHLAAPSQFNAPPRAPSWTMPGFGPRAVPEITVRPNPSGAGRGAPSRNAARPAAGPVNRPGGMGADEAEEAEMPGGPRAFCVRTCDGFYFPAGPSLGAEGRRAQQYFCEQSCPGAEVALYTLANSGTIEEAVGPRGQTYARLRTAFAFREGVSAACTCSGLATRGLARMPITHDFTLRAGDVVVTERGVRVFQGASRFPYRPSDFVEARNYSRLPADVQRRVAEIQAGIRAGDQGAAAPVSRLGAIARRATPRLGVGAHADASDGSPVSTLSSTGVRIIDEHRFAPIARAN